MVSKGVNLIVGTGKLGHRFYDYLQSLDQTAITLSRSPKAWSKQHICYDLLQNDLPFPQLPKLNTVFIILAPGERSEVAYRQTYIQAVTNLLTHLHQQQSDFHCVLVSSTSVFSGNPEFIINEQTEPQPDSFSGRILLEAEGNIKSLHPNTSIVRPSGLYSSQRQRLIDSLLDKAQYDNPKWLNLIHEHDVCQWLWQTAIYQWPLTIASDGFPFQRRQLQDFKQAQTDRTEHLINPSQTAKYYLSDYREQINLRYPSIFHWLKLRM
ncbi:sugar nucleotide-binding protein [Kangiella sp. M94]